ncbi:hypothetical protein VTN96DRAFT_857 [Rasamsonia emersonii]
MATLQVPLVRQGLQHRIDGDRVAIRRIRRISRARTKEKYVSRPLDRPATDRLGPRETTDQLATARLSGPLNDSSTWARGAGKLAERHSAVLAGAPRRALERANPGCHPGQAQLPDYARPPKQPARRAHRNHFALHSPRRL